MGHYISTSIYKYYGDFKTELRLKFKFGENIIYSNTFIGNIQYSQFIIPSTLSGQSWFKRAFFNE